MCTQYFRLNIPFHDSKVGDYFQISRSSHTEMLGLFIGSLPDVFCKNGVLKNFAKFTIKHSLPESLF